MQIGVHSGYSRRVKTAKVPTVTDSDVCSEGKTFVASFISPVSAIIPGLWVKSSGVTMSGMTLRGPYASTTVYNTRPIA